jgi:hypothetical protein
LLGRSGFVGTVARLWPRKPGNRAEQRSLAAEHVSERKIAELVFGDARYRGRIERILRSSRTAMFQCKI